MNTSPTSPAVGAQLRAALGYAERGIPVFPCRADGPKAKKPFTHHGFKDAVTNDKQIREWWTKWPNALIGMPTGEKSGLVVVDIDKNVQEGKDGESALRQLLQDRGVELPSTKMATTPRGGRHLYFKHPGTKIRTVTDTPVGAVDIRGDGGYIIAPPSVSEVGRYAWIDETAEVAPIPVWLLQLLSKDENTKQELVTKSRASGSSSLSTNDKFLAKTTIAPSNKGELNRIRSALGFINASDRTTWRDVGFALKSELGDAGWTLFDEWSQTAPEAYDEATNRRQWDSFSAEGGITIGTLFHLAQQNGWTSTKCIEASTESPAGPNSPAVSSANQEEFQKRLAQRLFDQNAPPAKAEPRFTLKGIPVCTPGNLTTIAAQAKAGKSAVVHAMNAATFCSEGADCLGFQGKNVNGWVVLHIDTEQSPFDHWRGVERARRRAGAARVPAWLRSYCLTGFTPFDTRRAVANLLAQAKAEFGGVYAVLIDGAADCVQNVNDPAEAGSFVAELHDFAIRFNCPIINIIHVNPGGEKTRGHLGSQLERKSETNLRIDKNKADISTLWSDKNRGAPIPKSVAPRFKWNDVAKMHVACDGAVGLACTQASAALVEAIARTFSTQAVRYNELCSLIESKKVCSKSTAKRRIAALESEGMLKKDGSGLYLLANNTSQ